MGTLPPSPASGPALDEDEDDTPRLGITARLLIWLLAGPVLAALAGWVALKVHEARWFRAIATAARINGVAEPAGPSFTAMCADPALALPSCIDLTVIKAIFVTATITGVLGLALFGGLLDLRRRAAGGRSRLVRAFRPALSITIGAVSVLLVLNAALAVMTIYVLPLGEADWALYILSAFVVIAMVSGLARLARVVLSLRHEPVNEVMGRRLRPSESPNLRLLVTDVARRVGTAPPRHLIVGLLPNFFATQGPVTCGGETFTGRTLFISLPLCRVLRPDELASVIGHELGHFRGRDTEFTESIGPIYRGAIETLTTLMQGVSQNGWQSILLRPALYTLAVFLDGLHEAELVIRREREYTADQASVTASNAEAAAAALVKAHAFGAAWDDIVEEACRLREEGRRVDNFSTLFAERAAARSAAADPLANLLDQPLALPGDSHPPLGARLAHIGITLEQVRERALNVAPAEAASDLVDNLESIERGQSAALQAPDAAMEDGACAEGGWWRASGRPIVIHLAAAGASLALAIGIAWVGVKFFPRPWFPPAPAAGKSLPLPMKPELPEAPEVPEVSEVSEVPDRAALLALLRDRQYDALERELAEAVRRSRESPRDEIIATTAFRTFWIADESITPLLDEWVGRNGDSPIARLARARHAAALGSAARGTRWARQTSAAQLAAMRKHHASARQDLREALKRDPALVEAHAQLIQIARHDRIERCEASGAPALRVAPASYRLRAVILECLEPRWGGSLERMRAFALVSQHYARENPRLSALHGYVEMDLGRTLASDDRGAEAVAAYTVALSHGPDAMFYDRRASSHRAMGDHSRALADIDAALTLLPQNPDLLADRAYSLDKLGRPAEAIETIALAARIDPSDEGVRRMRRYLNQRGVPRARAR